MSGFEPRWLELREPADKRARAASAIEPMLRIDVTETPMRILDLGAGTGANLRFLAPRLGGRQEWLLVDADRRLFDALAPAMEAWAARTGYRLRRGTESTSIECPGFQCSVRVLELDMAAQLADLPIEGQRLVTASALLDLGLSASYLPLSRSEIGKQTPATPEIRQGSSVSVTLFPDFRRASPDRRVTTRFGP